MSDTAYIDEQKFSIESLKLQQAWVEHKFLILFVLAFNLIGISVITLHDPASLPTHLNRLLDYIFASLKFISTGIAIFALFHIIKTRPKDSPIGSVIGALRKGPLAEDNLLRCLIGYLSLVMSIPLFVKLKTLIPIFHPFDLDPAFESLDLMLHFGHQPWELLQTLVGHPWVTMVIHRLYYLWFPVILVTYYWQLSTRKDPVLRQQFLLSFIASWILIGTVLATALSSAGPIFYAQIVPEDASAYAVPMEYLLDINAESPMFMFEVKEILWARYTGALVDGNLAGISAMPSMHVAVSFLLMLFGWRVNKWFGGLYTAFFAFILVGSVHLLWHYAIDGYVSMLVTFAIWKASGMIAKRSVAAAERVETP